MNKVISFVFGALAMFVIMFSINVFKDDSMDFSSTEVATSSIVDSFDNGNTNDTKVPKKIAFVNGDLGVGNANIARSLIENIPVSNGYKAVATTYDDAINGIENDKYVAYIMFDTNYSANLFSVATDELPEKAKITLKLNSNLSDEQLTEVNEQLFKEYMYVTNTISYLYIAYLLDIVHNTQNDVAEVIENEDYINSISSSVADYTSNVTASLEDYLQDPPETEIDLNVDGLQELTSKNIEQLNKELGIDSEQLLNSISTSQSQFNASINNQMLDSDIAINNINLDLNNIDMSEMNQIKPIINEFFMTNLQTIASGISIVESIDGILNVSIEFFDTLPDTTEFSIPTILQVMVVSSITDNADQLNEIKSEEEYAHQFEIINNFVLSYARWYTTTYDIPLDVCQSSDEVGITTITCLDDFNESYSDNYDEWSNEYTSYVQIYDNLTNTDSDFTNNLATSEDEIRSYLESITDDSDYVNDILITGDGSIEFNKELTENYCLNSENSNIVEKFSCGLNNIVNEYNTGLEAIEEYNSTFEEASQSLQNQNENLQTSVNNINQNIDNSNQKLNSVVAEHEQDILNNTDENVKAINGRLSETKNEINTIINNTNSGKNEFIVELAEKLVGYEESLNASISSVEESQYDDRKGVYDVAEVYNDEYKTLADGYQTNVSLLNLFASILPATRNGNDANYYLYEYLIDPVDIVSSKGIKNKEETIDPITTDDQSKEHENTEAGDIENDMKLVIILVSVLIIGLLAYLFIRNDAYED